MTAVARISGLTISVAATDNSVVTGADLEVHPAQIVGLAGETGSGKSTLGLALLGFTAPGLRRDEGIVEIDGTTVLGSERASDKVIRDLRGRVVSSVPQDPASALNPGLRIGESFDEVLRAHGVSDPTIRADRRADLFDAVGLPPGEEFSRRYPHEVSGGQLQRVAIAIAFALQPAVVVMDEPTTGLDVSTTTKIATLVKDLAVSRGVGVVLISHDLRLLLTISDRVVVVYQGRIVEQGTPRDLVDEPLHHYTRRLLDALPRTDAPAVRRDNSRAASVVKVEALRARYGAVQVTQDVTFSLPAGACLAIVGESGSGKTTTARSIAGLHREWDGRVTLGGEELAHGVEARSRAQRKALQYVFQNPYGSLNPRHTIGHSIAAVRHRLLQVSRSTARADAVGLIEQVGLRADHLHALPHQLSGGQRQRAALARALAAEPDVLVCDEVTSSLDVSVQQEVIELLQRLQRERGLAMLFITHDLGLARQMADETLVLWGGAVVEQGPTDRVLARPEHEYTRSLLSASRAVEDGFSAH